MFILEGGSIMRLKCSFAIRMRLERKISLSKNIAQLAGITYKGLFTLLLFPRASAVGCVNA